MERFKKLKKNNKGFTLMEMIIVVAIIAILIALIAPNLTGFLSSATQTSYEANAKSCYTAASAWAVQQKINGSAVTATSITVEKSGVTNPSNLANKAALEETIDCAALDSSAKVVITLEGGVVKSVKYYSDSSASSPAATYPKPTSN
ncbi:MAG: prepilin-type N-terminal cleavage/methylation domain-containing protein [Lachnospiraceae bacterium]